MWPLHGYFRRRLVKWLDRRIPPSSEHHLTLNSIFILPTGFGWSFILLSLCLFLLGTNYQNNLMLLLSYLCLSIMLLTLFYTHQNFARLALKAKSSDPFHCNEEGELRVQVIPHVNSQSKHCNGELLLTWLNDANSLNAYTEVSDAVDATHSAKQSVFRVSLNTATNESNKYCQTFSMPLNIPYRGRFDLGRLTIACDFPLGLYKCWTHLDFKQHVTVYARPQEGPVFIEKISNAEESNNESHTKDPTGNEDFYSLSDYEIGHPLNRVSWKHVAKNGNWVSKSFTSQGNDSDIISISSAIDTETAVSALTHAVMHWTESDRAFGLRYKGINTMPNHGVRHLHDCLSALACLDSSSGVTYTNSDKAVTFSSAKKGESMRAVK